MLGFMKTIQLTRYKLHRYFFSPKITIPFIVIAIFTSIVYSMAPLYVCSGFIMSGILNFFLSAFICMNIGAGEEIVEEQLLMLHGKKRIRYYMGRELSFVSINLVYTLVLTIIPLILNVVDHNQLFLRSITKKDVVCGSMTIFFSGLAGIAIADLFHKQIMKDRNLAVILTILFMIITVVIDAVIQKNQLPAVIAIVFPPVMDPASYFVRTDQFIWEKVILYAIQMVLYFAGYGIVKCFLRQKNMQSAE